MARNDILYIGTNTKMYKTPSEAAEHIRRLGVLTADISGALELFVLPSYTSLPQATQNASAHIRIGAQNMSYEERGQYTGEISPLMLKELGVELVMLGHSERRNTFLETDENIRLKVNCALANNMTALLCVGETLSQKKYKTGIETLRMQLKICLSGVRGKQTEKIVVAYEPVWAIGENGIPADESYANDMHRAIKNTLCELFGIERGNEIPVLYGGSVNAENAVKLIKMPWIDGLFIGRSAWDADNFNRIIRCVLPLFAQKKDERTKRYG